MRCVLLGFVAGVCLLQFQADLPQRWQMITLLACALSLLFCLPRSRIWRQARPLGLGGLALAAAVELT